LPHIFERAVIWAITLSGAHVYFYSGNVLKLKDDLAEVKPTIFPSVPRLFNKFYDIMKG